MPFFSVRLLFSLYHSTIGVGFPIIVAVISHGAPSFIIKSSEWERNLGEKIVSCTSILPKQNALP